MHYAHEMKSWALLPNRACYLHKSFVALDLPLDVLSATGLSAGEMAEAKPRVVCLVCLG